MLTMLAWFVAKSHLLLFGCCANVTDPRRQDLALPARRVAGAGADPARAHASNTAMVDVLSAYQLLRASSAALVTSAGASLTASFVSRRGAAGPST